MIKKQLFEKLAFIEHERWSQWQEYMMKESFRIESESEDRLFLSIPKKHWENWERQIKTPYSKLSEKEKNSDRDQVNRYCHLIQDL